ncbi:MAG TPA: zinc ribbon domain-containing protein [Thermoanaerobaculia bacterium]|nr:zinc ribbon domain-containing protein [Thermoanaerobaculia bacterium]
MAALARTLSYEPAAASLRCPSCGSPADEGTAVCTTCGTVLADLAAPGSAADTRPLTTGFSCRSCGATVACEPGPRSYACAFCGSTYVAEVRGEGLSALVPEFLVPFRIGKDQACGIFGDWCRSGFFTPRDVRQAGRIDRLQGIYLPFWTFSMRADSTWEADIGEWWYKESSQTYTDAQGKTRSKKTQVRHTEWHPLRGKHHSYHYHFLVSGAYGLPQAEALAVGPFQLLEMRRYRPHYLAGWLAEPFSVPREQALAECQQAFREAEGARIRAFLPGDTQSGVEWTTTFSEVSDDLVLLPFWIGTYSYRGKVYRYVLNGQTGKATGTRPVSPVKVGLLVAGVLLAILLIVLLSLGDPP